MPIPVDPTTSIWTAIALWAALGMMTLVSWLRRRRDEG